MATFPNGYSNAYGSRMTTWTMCENCSVRPKYPGHDYCSKACARQQAPNAWQPPSSQWDPRGDVYGMGGPFSGDESTLCESCGSRGKSSEMKQDGTVIQHPYCGILCFQSSQAPTTPTTPTSNPTDSDSLGLRSVDLDSEIGEKIDLKMQERWDSDEIALRELEAIYRVNLPRRIYRRFDFALQCNDFCTVVTTYYGGIPTCDIADDLEPVPCYSEDCLVCETLRNAFSNLFSNTPFDDDTLGPGLWTDLNPARAHQAAAVNSSQRRQPNEKVVLIQCRVVTKINTTGSINPYAGCIDDSGSVFCNRPVSIIPTHLLIYRAREPAKGLSRKRTMADGPLADLGRSKTTTDTRKRRRVDPSELEPSRDHSPPTKAVGPPFRADAGPPLHARHNLPPAPSSAAGFLPPLRSDLAVPPPGVIPPIYSTQNPLPPPPNPAAPPWNASLQPHTTRNLPPAPSNPADFLSPPLSDPAVPPPGVIPPFYNPPAPPPNPSGILSPLLPPNSIVPPPGAIRPFYPTHNPLPSPNYGGLLSSLSPGPAVVPAPGAGPSLYPMLDGPPAAPNPAGTLLPLLSGSVMVPAPTACQWSSRVDPDPRRPPPAAPDLAGLQSPLSPGRAPPPPPGGSSLYAELNPFSSAASNPLIFASPFSLGPAPGSTIDGRSEIQWSPVSCPMQTTARRRASLASDALQSATLVRRSNSRNRASSRGRGSGGRRRGNPTSTLMQGTHREVEEALEEEASDRQP